MKNKFFPGDRVNIISYHGAIVPVEVFSYYTSDKENHCASPHNRYVCFETEYKGGNMSFHLHDVSENELELVEK
jgi:hypothetical protein